MKVIFNPIKEIYITHITKLDVHRLTKLQAVRDKPLMWCAGLLFSIDELDNKDLVKKQSEGILYLDSFTYAEQKDFIEVSKWNGYSIEVLDLTGHVTTEQLIHCIVENRYDA